MRNPLKRRWVRWGLGLAAALVIVLATGLSVGASFLITNASFSFPERGLPDPGDVGLEVTDVRYETADGIEISAWWNAGDPALPAIVFVHGLNRTRQELVERAARASARGYGTLLIDLRNHGASARAYTTLGVHESLDVCGGAAFVRADDPDRPIATWGVSLGAASSLLAAGRCPDRIDAAIADSSFLSVDDTVGHHLNLITRLPEFPLADMIVGITAWRMNFSPGDGDVARAIESRPDLPVLIFSGSDDVRMPPDVARRLRAASAHPASRHIEVPGAGHGHAFEVAGETYLREAFDFLDRVFPAAGN